MIFVQYYYLCYFQGLGDKEKVPSSGATHFRTPVISDGVIDVALPYPAHMEIGRNIAYILCITNGTRLSRL